MEQHGGLGHVVDRVIQHTVSLTQSIALNGTG
eukprot:COSAG05_NODE_7130_length_852_cov_1.435591_1_plen_31_part_10